MSSSRRRNLDDVIDDVTTDPGSLPTTIPERAASDGRPDAHAGVRAPGRPDGQAPGRPDAQAPARAGARTRGRASARARESDPPATGPWRRAIEVEARRYAAAAARLAARDAELGAVIAAAAAAGYPADQSRALLDELGITSGPYPASAVP
jgi:hypothetical protein